MVGGCSGRSGLELDDRRHRCRGQTIQVESGRNRVEADRPRGSLDVHERTVTVGTGLKDSFQGVEGNVNTPHSGNNRKAIQTAGAVKVGALLPGNAWNGDEDQAANDENKEDEPLP